MPVVEPGVTTLIRSRLLEVQVSGVKVLTLLMDPVLGLLQILVLVLVGVIIRLRLMGKPVRVRRALSSSDTRWPHNG